MNFLAKIVSERTAVGEQEARSLDCSSAVCTLNASIADQALLLRSDLQTVNASIADRVREEEEK